ncbi:hypothetical protein Tco_1194587 [Tanacetum coccineum]
MVRDEDKEFDEVRRSVLRCSTEEQREGTEEKVESMLVKRSDDENNSTLLLNYGKAKAASKRRKEKDSSKIDPKRKKGKKKIEEEDELKEWEAEEESKTRLLKKSNNEALIKNFNDIKAELRQTEFLLRRLQAARKRAVNNRVQETQVSFIDKLLPFPLFSSIFSCLEKFHCSTKIRRPSQKPDSNKNQLGNQMLSA